MTHHPSFTPREHLAAGTGLAAKSSSSSVNTPHPLPQHQRNPSTGDSLSAQAGSFFRDIGLHPLCLVALLCALVIFPLAIAVPWVSIDHRDSRAEAQTQLHNMVESALTQLTSAFDTFGSIINSQSAFVKSQLHLGPTDGRPFWFANASERNITIVTNTAWMAFVNTIQQRWPGLVTRHFIRQMGIMNKLWPPAYNGGAGSFSDSLQTASRRYRAAVGDNSFRHGTGGVTGRLVYIAEHQIYRVRDPIFDFEYNDSDPTTAPANAHQFWGSTGCIFEAFDFIHALRVVERFEEGFYDVAVRLGAPNSNALDADLIDNTTDDAVLFRLCGGGAPGSRHCGSGDQAEHPIEIGYRQVNNDSAVYLAATPKPGQWNHNFPIRTLLFVLFGSLLVAFLACGVVTGLFYFLAQRKAKALNRVRYAPKTLPVPIAVLTIVDSDRIWSEDPLAMGAVTRELEKVIWTTIQKYDAFQCRKIDDAVVLTARSPKKLLDCVSEIVTAMATHPWPNGESMPFVDQCVAVHATLHLCTRAKILFNPSRHPNRCDYSGGDYDELFALHRRSLIARRLPIVLTEAFFFRLFNTVEEAEAASEGSMVEVSGSWAANVDKPGREATYRVSMNSSDARVQNTAKMEQKRALKPISVRAFPPANFITRQLHMEFVGSAESSGSGLASNAHNCSGRKLLSEALLPLFYAGSCRISLVAATSPVAADSGARPPNAPVVSEEALLEQQELDNDRRESEPADLIGGNRTIDDPGAFEAVHETLSDGQLSELERSDLDANGSLQGRDGTSGGDSPGSSGHGAAAAAALARLPHVCRDGAVAEAMRQQISEMAPATQHHSDPARLAKKAPPGSQSEVVPLTPMTAAPSACGSATLTNGGAAHFSERTVNNTHSTRPAQAPLSPSNFGTREGLLRTASYFYEAFSCAFMPFSDESIRFIFKAIDAAFTLTANRRGEGSRTDLFSRLAVRCARILAASVAREARMHRVAEQQFRDHQQRQNEEAERCRQQQQQRRRAVQPHTSVTEGSADGRTSSTAAGSRNGYDADQGMAELMAYKN